MTAIGVFLLSSTPILVSAPAEGPLAGWLGAGALEAWRIDLSGPGGRRVSGGAGHAEIEALRGEGLGIRLERRGSEAGVVMTLAIDRLPEGWSIEKIAFPDLALSPPPGARILYPRVSGCLKEGDLAGWRFDGQYPSGWCSMQFAAVCGGASSLYIGVEDPTASTKSIILAGEGGGLRIAAEWPAPDAGNPANAFRLPGRVRIAEFSGDWYDACRIYRRWVEAEAPWWRPRQRPTPRWFEEVAVWALTGGTADAVVEPVKAFAAAMGVPAAAHWYNWHQIPFDVRYPHYFPAKEGFADGVRAIQAAGIAAMPYINGRLWDTALEDFGKEGIAAATKDREGKPYIEEYGSGAKLAPMCPATALWRAKVEEIVLRLTGPEFGVRAVYIDQIAAAAPRLCYDASHGHPVGGGSWWIDRGYRPMLEALREKLPPDAAITTECNAEPYLDLVDGYLTWHFQYADAVPAFAAVYGGRIHLFGRAYRGGPTADLALRMKAAESLVWGEAIGWIAPDAAKHPVNGPYLRRVARLRHLLRACLAEGAMLRPPRIDGDVPEVTADWRWSGEWPVTRRAVRTGAWKARDGRIAIIAANVTGDRFGVTLRFDPAEYGLPGGRVVLARIGEDGVGEGREEDLGGGLPLRLGPYEVWAGLISRTAAPADKAPPKGPEGPRRIDS
ncbi:MAG: hypothetical protein JXP34_26265 [Planctomycetes bacterium]|nr:hypothetical protein [Planctomycetota bacterium]